MDTLSDLLRFVRLDGAFFYAVEASNPWRVESMNSRDLTPRILPTAEHRIPYHLVTSGRCYARLLGGDPVELMAGDVVVFPHGDAHQLASELGEGIPTLHVGAEPAQLRETVSVGGGGHRATSFLCGYLGIDRRPFNPLLGTLPRLMHLRGVSGAWHDGFTRQITEESQLGRAGADCVLTRMAELMFIQVLRRYLEDLPPGQTGWLAGLRDETVGRALALLHAQPAHPWTLADLAREVATSRSNLARRFTDLVGQPPMQYLAQWRMQIAANLLSQSGAKISAIAAEVGYDSEAAFSRAFKKATGESPGAWRENHRTAHR